VRPLLLLKSEERSSKGILRYEVTRVDYDVDVPGALFSYAPPAGTMEFARMQDLKLHLAGGR